MKTLLSSLFGLILSTCMVDNAGATVHNISVADFSFTPSTLAVQLGDTVRWNWVNGAHTTTSTTIPAGAATWDSPLQASSTSFTYVPTVAGTYNYVCTPHSSMGMGGSFTVQDPNSIKKNAVRLFSVSPNPANTEIKINTGGQNLQVSMTDAIGRMVRLYPIANINNEQSYSVRHLPPGVYMLMVRANGNVKVQKLFIE